MDKAPDFGSGDSRVYCQPRWKFDLRLGIEIGSDRSRANLRLPNRRDPGRNGVKLRYYVKMINEYPVTGTRFSIEEEMHTVFDYIQKPENFPVTLRFVAPTISTNEKIILSSMFHSLFTIAVQLSPAPKSSGIELLETTNFKLYCLQTRTGVKFVVVTSSNAVLSADTLLSKNVRIVCGFRLEEPFLLDRYAHKIPKDSKTASDHYWNERKRATAPKVGRRAEQEVVERGHRKKPKPVLKKRLRKVPRRLKIAESKILKSPEKIIKSEVHDALNKKKPSRVSVNTGATAGTANTSVAKSDTDKLPPEKKSKASSRDPPAVNPKIGAAVMLHKPNELAELKELGIDEKLFEACLVCEDYEIALRQVYNILLNLMQRGNGTHRNPILTADPNIVSPKHMAGPEVLYKSVSSGKEFWEICKELQPALKNSLKANSTHLAAAELPQVRGSQKTLASSGNNAEEGKNGFQIRKALFQDDGDKKRKESLHFIQSFITKKLPEWKKQHILEIENAIMEIATYHKHSEVLWQNIADRKEPTGIDTQDVI
ncbi:unnamed protein product [Caenorhabditis auriculariae]|uniref:Trafficking protein particle complex subunit 4 n=1 Tax=Caenorhabditis auriculariae TaxID=2777116 RepID=A0A8S1H5L4_9PELO|nr:unnamed protein product [Caenorhabditis auriculariae]